MGFDFRIFEDEGLTEEFVEWLVDEQSADIRTHFGKLWEYYRNEAYEFGRFSEVAGKLNESSRCYVQAQEYGLPSRITGIMRSAGGGVFGGRAVKDVQRKEVVIENDISWRINAMVDFLFGKPVSIVCKSPDSQRRAEIEAILRGVFEANGDVRFFQDMAVLGSVYGFADCIVRPGERVFEHTFLTGRQPPCLKEVIEFARTITLELIEAPRALPVLDENDYKKTRYYVQHFHQQKNSLSRKGGFLSRLLAGKESGQRRERVAVTEIIGPDAWQRYENQELVAEGPLPWGVLPVVHIQNIAQPYYYEGLSDVEPLIPLQDELNTRLSDRANRITFQSFKMYLAKGIEGFEDRPISPGRMWCTDNVEATIDEFGGDVRAPSEDLHIAEIREGMDKTSGVTPVVAGLLKSKLGHLTSAVALRMTLMGMLAKTERKKLTYSGGLKKIGRLVLRILDEAGIYCSEPADRDLGVIFASPLPENVMEKLKEAQIKRQLGVPQEQVLKELGYWSEGKKAGREAAEILRESL
jgi:hypothetical protein